MKFNRLGVKDIRDEFADLYKSETFVIDKTGAKVVEIIGSSFVIDRSFIFGKPNEEYIERELAWYKSRSLNVNDIPDQVPAIWKAVATPDGLINSNYGYLIFSEENGDQFNNVVRELDKNPFSRRAEMIYTRPSMHSDYNAGGMSDFVCTEAVQYFIRDNRLDVVVKMRSNDAWAGFRNDLAWQQHVQGMVQCELKDTSIDLGDIYWCAGSLHVYEKNFYLIDHYVKTGEPHITKEEYDAKYR